MMPKDWVIFALLTLFTLIGGFIFLAVKSVNSNDAGTGRAVDTKVLEDRSAELESDDSETEIPPKTA